jgi:cell division septation protein DedD
MRVALAAISLVIAQPVAAQSVRAGIEAWSAGRHAEAVAIWRPLAAKGNADAAFNLGQAHKLGRGVPADLATAQRFYEQAGRAGHLEAQTSLGLLLFQNGNRTGAMRWLKAGANGGEPRAMLLYGTALFNGDGVPENRVQAYALVSRAAAAGLPAAKATLEEMDQLIPAEDRRMGLAVAQDLAARQARRASPSPAAANPPKATPQPVAVASTARRGAPAAPALARTGPIEGGAFRIQLGAFRDRGAATALYRQLAPRLGGAAMTLVPSGTMTRLQAGPYATRSAANAACAALKPQPCFPVAAR